MILDSVYLSNLLAPNFQYILSVSSYYGTIYSPPSPLSVPIMSQRPTLKLKLNSQPSTPAPVDSPSTAPPKLKLKFGSGTKAASPKQTSAAPPASLAPPITKAPRKTNKDKPARTATPTAKKRALTASTISDDDDPLTRSAPPAKIPKITLKTRPPSTSKPFIRVRTRGEKPFRPVGVGYDSEASDREDDPTIEEDFVLRMQPGDDCEYLRQAIAEKNWGPKSEGGADVKMRFLKPDGRRATVTVRGQMYAASMVDLPCIVEGMKSWDRRGWWKSVDICQMLLVLGSVTNDEQALTYPLPREVDEKTWQYAHGLTPPMRWARKRRFRKRVSNRTIEAVEEEVERLLKLDNECEGESKYEVLDIDRLTRELSAKDSEDQGDMEDCEQDAEGDVDDMDGFFEGAAEDDDAPDDGLEADLEQALAEENLATTPDPTFLPLTTPISTSTPAPTPSKPSSVDDTSSAGEDESDAGASEVDEDELEQQQDLQRQREEIGDLEAAVRSQEAELAKLQNPILRQKLVKKIQSLQGDLELKMAAIGEGADD